MDRREFLAAGATLAATAAGGCTGCERTPTASLEMNAVSDPAIAHQATWDVPGPASDLHSIVEGAVENDSAIVEDTEPHLPDDEPVVYDDAVYRLSYEVVDSEPATSFQFTLDPAESVDADETIRYDELPAVDREKFPSRGLDEPGSLGFGSSLLYLDEEIPDSMLVPNPEYSVVVWDDDTRGRFEVSGSYDTELNTYRFTAQQVDSSVTAYGQTLRKEYEFELVDLSDGERDVVQEAIESEHGYAVPGDESPPDALETLAERFQTRRPIQGGKDDSPSISGTYVVRYDGEVYWTRLFVDESKFRTPTEENG
jgi:hypothetical protein